MTRSQRFLPDLPDNNFDSWMDWVESPSDKLIFDLSVIPVNGSLHRVQYYRFVKILTPCGVVNLHGNSDIARSVQRGLTPMLHHEIIGMPLNHIATVLCVSTKDKQWPASMSVNQFPGVCLGRSLRRHHQRAIWSLFYHPDAPLPSPKNFGKRVKDCVNSIGWGWQYS